MQLAGCKTCRVHDSPVRRLARTPVQCCLSVVISAEQCFWALGTVLKDLSGSSRAKRGMLQYLCGSLPLLMDTDQ